MAGMPSSLFARVRLEVLVALLGGRSDSLLAVPAGSAAVRGNATASVSPNVETRVRHSHSLVSTKPPSLIRRNRHQCSDETAIPHKEQSTGGSLQPQNTVSTPAGEPPPLAAVGGGEALIFPDRLLPQERDAAQRLLSQVADQPQALLDELAGRLQTERVRSPVAYLRGLIQRAAWRAPPPARDATSPPARRSGRSAPREWSAPIGLRFLPPAVVPANTDAFRGRGIHRLPARHTPPRPSLQSHTLGADPAPAPATPPAARNRPIGGTSAPATVRPSPGHLQTDSPGACR